MPSDFTNHAGCDCFAFTCPGADSCVNWCYSFTAWRYPAAFFRQLQNTLLILHRKAVVANEFAKVKQGSTVRLYVDGDFDSLDTLTFWMNCLQNRPDVQAYGYSKSWQLFIEYYDLRDFPSNYALNLSSGSKYDADSALRQTMLKLPCTRGEFIALPTVSHADYENRDNWRLHAKELRSVAANSGMGRVFTCPGRCGTCTPAGHACGSQAFRGIPIVIGIH
jgi:hypothetical protein